MLSGFNTNFRHRGAVFHVQTENTTASGESQLITHLYYGGTILASEKSPSSGDETGPLREQMERQHVAMLKSLRDGEFDELIVERLGAEVLGEPEKSETQPTAASAEKGVSGWNRQVARERLDVLVADYLIERGRRGAASSSTPPPRTAK